MELNLCRICQQFYGSQEGLCSKCYQVEKLKQSASETLPSLVDSLSVISEESKNSHSQSNPEICYYCHKRTGPLSFKCRCDNFFCSRHRLPEEHLCSFDHKTQGIRKLSEENPLIKAEKFTRL
ncbi:unnamed protein product [Blepharisma stoltei]|uniref:AN1-type domain-containing protein n=1 Tax=Blepharisma stoltei TaxID=1481888 RepID=A0AAU9K2M1_9CILI|nr:unnamed protein product [Blepharisma stoltei]